MKVSKNKTYLAIFLLSVFSLLRVADFHALAHLDDDTTEHHCEFCAHVVEGKKGSTHIVVPVSYDDLQKPIFFPEINDLQLYDQVPFQKPLLFNCIFNKPPPSELG